jgi:hypothetical protein
VSRFHNLHSRTRFCRYRGRQFPFSCVALLDLFSASGPVFMFCASGLIFGGTAGVGTNFHVLRARTRFRRYRGRQVPFSCFSLLESFPALPRASGPVFMFCAPGLIFGGTECVGSCFHGLRSRARFRRYRGLRIPFSYFALPNTFSSVPRALGLIYMFCVPGLVFSDTEGVGSGFHVMRPWSRFHGSEGVGFHFHVLHARTCFRRNRGCRLPFSCFLFRTHFSCYRGRGSRFHVLISRTRFRRYGGCRVLFSCFARPDTFSAVSRASGPVFMFCAPEHVFGC